MKEYKIEEIKEGITESFQVIISGEMMEKFLEVTGDNNPLHCDEEFAISKKFRGRVVYGMLTSSFYSTLAGVYLPGKNCILHSVETKMLKPVYIGDKLTIKGEVCEVHSDLRMFRVKAMIVNQENQKVSKAILQVGILS